MALYRTDYVGRGELAARQGALGQFLKRLNQLATEFNFAAVCTNQMTSDPSGGMTFVSDPKKVRRGLQFSLRCFVFGVHVSPSSENQDQVHHAMALSLVRFIPVPSGRRHSHIACRMLQPIGGHVLAHAVQTRVALRKGSGADRIAKLVDSTTLPEGDATFTLTEGGVADSG
jgi:RecA/RadA recombinase